MGARRALRRLAEGSQPSWSPTGGVIAAVRRGWIVTVDVRSGRKTQVSDHSGVRTVDTSRRPGAGPFLTDLTLTGDVLSWNHDGAPRSITLQHPG